MPDTKTAYGVCTEISEKNGWTSFHIDVGSKYPLRLATKQSKIIEEGRAAGDSLATWTYKESEGAINENTGKPYINRYLDSVDLNGAAPDDAAPTVREQAEQSLASVAQAHHPPLAEADKQRAITRMACLKAAAETFRVVGEENMDAALEVMKIADRFERWVYRDLEDIPF